MKLDARAFALAVGNVAAIAFFICWAAFALAPGLARPTGAMFHMDYMMVYRRVGFGDLVVGVVGWWVISAILALATAILYNRALATKG